MTMILPFASCARVMEFISVRKLGLCTMVRFQEREGNVGMCGLVVGSAQLSPSICVARFSIAAPGAPFAFTCSALFCTVCRCAGRNPGAADLFGVGSMDLLPVYFNRWRRRRSALKKYRKGKAVMQKRKAAHGSRNAKLSEIQNLKGSVSGFAITCSDAKRELRSEAESEPDWR